MEEKFGVRGPSDVSAHQNGLEIKTYHNGLEVKRRGRTTRVVRKAGARPVPILKSALRPKTVGGIVGDVTQAARQFIEILDSSTNTVDTYEINVGAIPFSKVTAVTEMLDKVIPSTVGHDKIAINIKRFNSQFSFVLSRSYNKSGAGKPSGVRAIPGVGADNSVEVLTTVGTVSVTPPIDLLTEALSSKGVGALLSAYGKETRTLASAKRKSNLLIGLPVGKQFLYPAFQIDRSRKEIRPVVAHANSLLESGSDPWGALSWWFAESVLLGGSSPYRALVEGDLSVEQVERLLEADQQGMG